MLILQTLLESYSVERKAFFQVWFFYLYYSYPTFFICIERDKKWSRNRFAEFWGKPNDYSAITVTAFATEAKIEIAKRLSIGSVDEKNMICFHPKFKNRIARSIKRNPVSKKLFR